jgi:DNA polymerase III subunit delta'
MTALATLSGSLCPWLERSLADLEAARASGRLGHAWLIAGPAGNGKLNLALVFAQRLLSGGAGAVRPPALAPQDFATAMRARREPADHHPDLHRLFPLEDKRTIAIEQVREVIEALTLKAYRGAAKVVVIEPADALTVAAANGLLKTLEEPAGDSFLLLVSDQPDRLPATIRSRCQRINVAPPPLDALAAWLGRPAAEVAALALATGSSALALSGASMQVDSSINKGLEDKLVLVSKGELDPVGVADEWLKLDVERVLAWLLRRLHLAIQSRVAPGASNAVTDRAAEPLHNAWGALTLRKLFDQHEAAERLLNQLGGGINAELALRALLLGFEPDGRRDRGRR